MAGTGPRPRARRPTPLRSAVLVLAGCVLVGLVQPATAGPAGDVTVRVPVGVTGRLASDSVYVVGPEGPGDPVALSIAASQVSDAASPDVLVARADVFADSMASGPLQADRPLYLVDVATGVEDHTIAEMARRGATGVTLLGGEAALGPEIAAAFAGAGLSVRRLAGASRLETAVAVASEHRRGGAGSAAGTIVLTRAFPAEGSTDPSQAYADSLAAGAFSARFGWPILMTQGDVLSTPVRLFLAANPEIREVVVFGGTAAVSAEVTETLVGLGLSVRRVAGETRIRTAVAAADEWYAMNGDDVGGVTVIDGFAPTSWQAGFVLAALAADFDAPVVLTDRRDAEIVRRRAGETGDEDDIEDIEDIIRDAFVREFGGEKVEETDPVVVGTTHQVGEAARRLTGKTPVWNVTIAPRSGAVLPERASVTVTAPTAAGDYLLESNCALADISSGATAYRLDGSRNPRCTVDVVVEPDGDHVETRIRAVYSMADPFGTLFEGFSLPEIAADGTALVALGSDPQLNQTFCCLADVFGGVRVDLDPDGVPDTEMSPTAFPPRQSADGRFVVFGSQDISLAAGTAGRGLPNLFRADVVDSVRIPLGRDLSGELVPVGDAVAVSDDGDRVAYALPGLTTPSDGSSPLRVQLIAVQEISTGRVDVVRDESGDPVQLTTPGVELDLSGDGRWVTFLTRDDGLTLGDQNGEEDIFRAPVFGMGLERVTIGNMGQTPGLGTITVDPQISRDGDRVTFVTSAALSDEPRDEEAISTPFDVFVKDFGTDRLFTAFPQFGLAGGDRGQVSLSPSGGWVVQATTEEFAPDQVDGCGVYRTRVTGGRPPIEPLNFFPGQPCALIDRISVADDGTVVLGVSRPDGTGGRNAEVILGIPQ